MRASELILNPDQSIYHLGLHPDQVGDTIITVGDPERVGHVSRYFDKIIIRKTNREFVTHAGYIKDKRVTVISTGIGTDNIDIVLNELDALVNIDLKSGKIKDNLTSLNIIRIGTSGSLRADIDVDSYVSSKYAIGMDALQGFYNYTHSAKEEKLHKDLGAYLDANSIQLKPAISEATLELDLENIHLVPGITITAPGFYAPQSRQLRLTPKYPNLLDKLAGFEFENMRCTNLEMETAGIYMLSNLLGHKAISLNAILANRVTGNFSAKPFETIDKIIKAVIAHLRS